MDPRQLSYELRKGDTPHLNRRRWIIALSMVGAAMGKIVSLYQTGILKNLPDPPLRIFNSSKVDASTYAYKRMDTPDGLIMLVSYGITAWLAGAGGQRRERRSPWLPIAMSAKILFDVGTALELAREEWQENKALCAYCQVATVASLISLILAIPEMVDAIQNLVNQEDSRFMQEEWESIRDRAREFAGSR